MRSFRARKTSPRFGFQVNEAVYLRRSFALLLVSLQHAGSNDRLPALHRHRNRGSRRGLRRRYDDRRVYAHTMYSIIGGLWARIIKNSDCSIGLSVRPFARSLAPLTCLLAPHYSLCPCAPLHSLAFSLTHFAHSLARD